MTAAKFKFDGQLHEVGYCSECNFKFETFSPVDLMIEVLRKGKPDEAEE